MEIVKSFLIRNSIEFEFIQLYLYNKKYSWNVHNLRIFGVNENTDISILMERTINTINSYPITVYINKPINGKKNYSFSYIYNIIFKDTITIDNMVRKDKLKNLKLKQWKTL